MNILGISGSPKKSGFTNLLLDEALDGARAGGARTRKIILNDLVFRPCQECDGCKKTGICVYGDDMKDVYEKLIEADALIVATPVYFGTVTAQLKTMIDRCQSVWVSKYVLNKSTEGKRERKGALICVAGKDNEDYFENVKKIVKIFYATVDTKYSGDLFVGGLNEMTENSPKRKEAILRSYDMGLSLSK